MCAYYFIGFPLIGMIILFDSFFNFTIWHIWGLLGWMTTMILGVCVTMWLMLCGSIIYIINNLDSVYVFYSLCKMGLSLESSNPNQIVQKIKRIIEIIEWVNKNGLMIINIFARFIDKNRKALDKIGLFDILNKMLSYVNLFIDIYIMKIYSYIKILCVSTSPQFKNTWIGNTIAIYYGDSMVLYNDYCDMKNRNKFDEPRNNFKKNHKTLYDLKQMHNSDVDTLRFINDAGIESEMIDFTNEFQKLLGENLKAMASHSAKFKSRHK
jgi:hypothetical protein